MENKRLSWLDALRGFGIILITLGHLGCFELCERYIYSFHVPLFFFISGYLYKTKALPLKTYIKKKTMSILVPFLAWNIMSSMVEFLLGYNTQRTLFRMLTYKGMLCWNSPLWFLLVLYFTEVLFAILDRINSKTYFKFINIACCLVLFAFIGDIRLTLKLNLVPYAMIFYTMGNIMRTNIENKGFFLKRWQKIPSALFLFTVGFVVGGVLNVRIKYTHAIWGNYFYVFLAAFCSILFYYILFRNIDKLGYSKLLTYLGANSMIIMCSQYWVFRVCDILAKRLFNYILWFRRDTIKAVLFSAFTLTLICTLTYFYKKLASKNKTLKVIGNIFGVR